MAAVRIAVARRAHQQQYEDGSENRSQYPRGLESAVGCVVMKQDVPKEAARE